MRFVFQRNACWQWEKYPVFPESVLSQESRSFDAECQICPSGETGRTNQNDARKIKTKEAQKTRTIRQHFSTSAIINIAQEKLLFDHSVLDDVILIPSSIASVVNTDERI